MGICVKEYIKIVEVGPRDGLQNEKKILSIEDRVLLIKKLQEVGFKYVEGGSFVSPKAIPQMVDSEKVWTALSNSEGELSFLVPNMKGLERALSSGVKAISVFTATSDTFNRKNIGMSVSESLTNYAEVIERAKAAHLSVRGYVSTAFGCPYEGAQSVKAVVEVVGALKKMGCSEISIGDTIGVAHPIQIKDVFKNLSKEFSLNELAGHFHDTRGMAIANISTALDLGVRIFDSSVGGLGGCPYATGSSGNVASEEVVWFLEGAGCQTGVDLQKLLEVSSWVEKKIERNLRSKLYLSKPDRLFYT